MHWEGSLLVRALSFNNHKCPDWHNLRMWQKKKGRTLTRRKIYTPVKDRGECWSKRRPIGQVCKDETVSKDLCHKRLLTEVERGKLFPPAMSYHPAQSFVNAVDTEFQFLSHDSFHRKAAWALRRPNLRWSCLKHGHFQTVLKCSFD